MKNIKVRTKLTIILALVIVLVTSESFISIKNMNQLKDKALETMDTSSRQNYDDSIKEQVGVVISLLSEINNEYKSGKYTLDEAKKIAADEIRQMRYGEAGYFWVDQSDGKNIVLLGSSTEGTNRMNTKDADGYQMVKEIIRVAVQDGGGYTDYVFPKEGETEPSPKRSYSEYFKPFDWVVGTGNYTDYIDTAIAQQDEEFTSYASSKAISLILCSVCMLIVVAILVALIAVDITKSLRKIKEQFEVIAGGNFATKMQQPMLKRKDDFGQLANALETMRESVRSLLAQVKNEAANIDKVVETIDTNVYNLMIAVITAVIIVLAMNLVGSLLITALLVFPALSAMRVMTSFKSVIIYSAILSVFGAVFGIIISIFTSTPVGSTIVTIYILIFIINCIIGRILRI